MRDSEASEECTRISLRFRSHRYDTSGGSGKILHASGSEDKMLKLSSKIHLVPMLNGLHFLMCHQLASEYDIVIEMLVGPSMIDKLLFMHSPSKETF